MPEPLNLSFYGEISRPSGAVAAGTTAINGTGDLMTGYENIMYVAILGEVLDTATIIMKAQICADSGGTSAADITGATTTLFTANATSADNKVLILDVIRPPVTAALPYVRPVLTPAVANVVVAAIIGIRYGYKKPPVAQAIAIANKVYAAA
jgi:hypothetical protein